MYFRGSLSLKSHKYIGANYLVEAGGINNFLSRFIFAEPSLWQTEKQGMATAVFMVWLTT